ncbi:hypothetical protein BIFGAL_04004 [Bifidobacterium gallicum DSM 20093 = LMG 11596]|uniref:Uncharacterized protein n=1 Tax=Bifidobacterium gallicum DSM 20093 = LMG 11596 TaxID=561180 RepID=D1NVW0_9BIFI|nr:hypothetical protein BIFGAL_04004 [Bifidobacterium gallicum DSM 20093 = LMG 11596]
MQFRDGKGHYPDHAGQEGCGFWGGKCSFSDRAGQEGGGFGFASAVFLTGLVRREAVSGLQVQFS